jgi:hypothetical protein
MLRYRVISLLAFGIVPAFAQRLSIGVLGGGSLTDSFPTVTVPVEVPGANALSGLRYYSRAKDYIIGTAIELRLRSNWSLEVDGLYRTLHFTTAAVMPDGSLNGISPSPVVTWEFPVLAKYHFRWLNLGQFAELGPSFRATGNLNGTNPSHAGLTAGLGVEMHAGKINIAPELRYTRWAPDNAGSPFGQIAGYKSNPNQLELLLGFRAAAESDLHPLGRHFSIGVAAGAGLTDVRSRIIGPRVEFALPKGFALEADALYHPLRSNSATSFSGIGSGTGVIGSSSSSNSGYRGSGLTWELPVLAKYRFPTPILRPFVEGGPSFRLGGNVSSHGITAGVGVEAHLSVLRVAPSVRYTHWALDYPNCPSCSTNPNQAEVLVGFSF